MLAVDVDYDGDTQDKNETGLTVSTSANEKWAIRKDIVAAILISLLMHTI